MPAWSPDLPRIDLLRGPSPFHRLERLEAALGGRPRSIWIKREDLLPLAFGGNKLRNLEFLVGAALADGADALVTSGRRWSNHARLTAAAGAVAGLEVHLVLSGPPTEPENPGSRLDRMLGATVHMTGSAERDEREARVEQVVQELRAAGRRPWVIGVGGSGPVGAVGQVLAAQEMLDQAGAAGQAIDRVVVPAATGGTYAGLLMGLRMAGVSTALTGVVVARPEAELRPAVGLVLEALTAMTGVTVADTDIGLDGTQLGAGYGRPSAAAAAAAALQARTEGILVDPIYTAKAMAWLVAAASAGHLDGETVVFWHAGGTPGLFEPLD